MLKTLILAAVLCSAPSTPPGSQVLKDAKAQVVKWGKQETCGPLSIVENGTDDHDKTIASTISQCMMDDVAMRILAVYTLKGDNWKLASIDSHFYNKY